MRRKRRTLFEDLVELSATLPSLSRAFTEEAERSAAGRHVELVNGPVLARCPSARSERMNELVLDYARSPDAERFQRLRLQHVVPWAKVYARDFIESRGLRFDAVRHGDDIAFNVLAAVQARRVRAEAMPVYRIYRRPGSLTMDATPHDLLERLKVLGCLNERLRGLGVEERMHAASYVARAVRFGPATLLRVLRLMAHHDMLRATLRRLGPVEVWRFLRWARRSHLERKRLEPEGGSR